MNKCVGYLDGNLEHHLDHLAPLCSLMGWPLVVTDEEIFKLGEAYYPDLMLDLWPPLEAPFKITEQFDVVITTLPRIAFDAIFLIAEASMGKRLKTIWLPHGNSDKGHLLPWMEALEEEETIFVYGPKMVDFLSQKNVKKPKLVPIGNFRYLYFKKHELFYDNLLDTAGLKKSFILYAPTWKDAENSSSFERAAGEIVKGLSHLSLVIKPHPNELENIHVIQEQANSKATWLTHFPPIYPILERASHLIGDFSSIGYDFLMFNRPMFFLPSDARSLGDPGCFLHKYGTVICENNLCSLPKLLDTPAHDVKPLAVYTFGEESTWPLLIDGVKQLDI